MGNTWVDLLADLIDKHAAEICVVLALVIALICWAVS